MPLKRRPSTRRRADISGWRVLRVAVSFFSALQIATKACGLHFRPPRRRHAVAVAYLGAYEFENSLRAAQQEIRLNASFALGYCQLAVQHCIAASPKTLSAFLSEDCGSLPSILRTSFGFSFWRAHTVCHSNQRKGWLQAGCSAPSFGPSNELASGLKILAANALTAGQERQPLAAWQQGSGGCRSNLRFDRTDETFEPRMGSRRRKEISPDRKLIRSLFRPSCAESSGSISPRQMGHFGSGADQATVRN
jgi:hypothetical protein